MKVQNLTDYPTRELRSVMTSVMKAESSKRQLPRWQRDSLRVEVRYARRDRRPYTGHAYLNGTRAVLSVPRGCLGIAKFAALWRHELWHIAGVKHGDMPDSVMWCRPLPGFAGRMEEVKPDTGKELTAKERLE